MYIDTFTHTCTRRFYMQDLVATGDLAEHGSVWVWDGGDIEFDVGTMEWESGVAVEIKVPVPIHIPYCNVNVQVWPTTLTLYI